MKWQIYPPKKSASSSEWSFLISIVKAHIGRSSGRSNPPSRSSSSSECPFLISIVKAHTIKWQMYPDEVFYAKDHLPTRVTI